MPVLVLQPFAVERGAAGGAADEEAARAHVARRPGEIADALEAEHRIVDVERDHRHVRRRVGRRRRDPGGHRARLVDAFLEHLARLVLLVVHELVGVLRPVELADLAEDAELAEHALHAEGAAFVGHDRHDALADGLVAQERGSAPARRPWWSRSRGLRRSLQLRLEGGERRHLERLATCGVGTAESRRAPAGARCR